jgi:hypothetical protein
MIQAFSALEDFAGNGADDAGGGWETEVFPISHQEGGSYEKFEKDCDFDSGLRVSLHRVGWPRTGPGRQKVENGSHSGSG